ncbi:MAG: AMP-binding protein [Clostridiales bacterium]|nr:AMP-binding protein [Clostridiales bacterium]
MKSENVLNKNNIQDILPLAPVQKGMLFYYLNEKDSAMYFEQMSFRVSGSFNEQDFRKAWNVIVQKHPILRTLFRWKKLDNPVQIVLKQYEIPLIIHDLTSIPDDLQQEQLEKIWEQDRKEGINIEIAPMRILLIRLTPECFEMTLSSYHIILDGWSNGIILSDFLDAYLNLRLGKTPQNTACNQGYGAFIKWITNHPEEKAHKYWKAYLKGLQNKTLLPYDWDKTEKLQNAKQFSLNAPAGLFQNIQHFCVQHQITQATFYNYAWGVLLKKITDCNDVMFGVTVSGRNADILEIESIAGMFINTIPFRAEINDDDVIIDEMQKVMEENKERTEYENTPLTDIQRLSDLDIDKRENMFDSILVIENYPVDFQKEAGKDKLDIRLSHIYEMTNYDLTVVIHTSDVMNLRVLYNPGRFSLKTVRGMVEKYYYIMEQILSDNKSVREIFLLNKEERTQVLIDFNKTQIDFGTHLPIHTIVEKQAKETPELTALCFAEKTMTYRELNEKANQFAAYLRKKRLEKGDLVAVAVDRSFNMVIAMLAILKAGAAYLPIDIRWPEERILKILDQSNVHSIIIDNSYRESSIFTKLQGFETIVQADIHITPHRPHIHCFDDLPMPDRSHIDIHKYKDKIGMASVNNCISIQTTRGCPYECLYCHKIWSKKHVFRTAEHIFDEIQYFYQNGIRNFAIIDDCFNLNRENSGRLFKLIIKHGLKIQLFFPNGLRGDILTKDYIDLMVAAGTRGINLSLETASPRLQKLLKKNLNLDKFYEVVQYIVSKHPNVLLEMATMHGFPTETQEEAMQTLDFIKSIEWLSFPYIHILKIFPNTEMEAFALANGISKEKIMLSRNRAFHELPETLPFPKSFTRQYQAKFMNEYFLNKERLRKVLPIQMQILETDALIQKYNAYLPTEIKTMEDLLEFVQLDDLEISENRSDSNQEPVTIFDTPVAVRTIPPRARRILFLDLSQQFSEKNSIYNVTEQPLGHLYLLTYLKQVYGDQIDGRILKSGVDFDSLEELRKLILDYQPELIGIRTLTIFKEFFHETVSYIRQWYEKVPIITGGPYASSDYDTILKDRNVDLVLFGEGEYTLSELIKHMLNHDFQLPQESVLSTIKGIAYVHAYSGGRAREVFNVDLLEETLRVESSKNICLPIEEDALAYVMYTSGTTGSAKGVMVEHRQVNNCIWWMQKEFSLQSANIVIQRTNLTFDPSVWEIFWPLYTGACVRLIDYEQSRNAEFLISLMEEGSDVTVMYCPASMMSGMLYILENTKDSKLSIPWLLIGAEAVSADVVRNFYQYFKGKIVNTYGPTECTINNTYFPIDQKKIPDVIPIGRPIANNAIYILSSSLQPVPINMAGEIYIAGSSVARGYLNEEALTKDKFILSPFSKERLYKTGDLGKWNEHGDVLILGRCDEQIKIRGYRIEPGEIESVIYRTQGVVDCHVTLLGKRKEEIRSCALCGVTSNSPGITIDDEQICNLCRQYEEFTPVLSAYFKDPDQLRELINSRKAKMSTYDCLVVYNGGRGTAYALYKLKEMGVRVMTLTCDNGYFAKSELRHIKNITNKLGFDNEVLTHHHTHEILQASCEIGSTVCRGCFHMSSAMAMEYAYQHNIPVVIGATLSRGQIIENKLLPYLKNGMTEIRQIEKDLLNMQKSAPIVDKEIFKHIGFDEAKAGKVYNNVIYIDFYRYFDVTNNDMLCFLKAQDAFWESRKNYAIYSTNCPIKWVGDYMHVQEKGYHYYGNATSWEVRLGHISTKNLRDDLQNHLSKEAYQSFIKRLGYSGKVGSQEIETRRLCAYVVGDVEEEQLKEQLIKHLPNYMVPSHIIKMNKIPLTSNGKVDKKALPEPTQAKRVMDYAAPESEMEKSISDIWRNLLHIDRVGVKDNFFDLGGNSILLIQMHSQLEKIYPGKATVTDLFAYSTISKLAEFISEKENPATELPKINTLKFPESYRADSNSVVTGSILRAELGMDLSLSFLQISKVAQVELQDIFIGMFGYLLYEILHDDRIMLQALSEDMSQAIPISLDLTQIKDFTELFQLVNRSREHNKPYAVKNLNTKVKNGEVQGVIPVLKHTSSQERLPQLTACFGLVMETTVEQDGQLRLSLLYNPHLLKAEGMKELLGSYVQDLQALPASITGKSEE